MEIILPGIVLVLAGIYLNRYYKLSKKSFITGVIDNPHKPASADEKEEKTVERNKPRFIRKKDLPKFANQSIEAKMLYNKAMIFYKRGDLATAEKQLIQVTSLDENFLDANNKLGVIYLKQGQFGKAEAIFKQLISKAKNAIYLSNLGRAQYEQNKFEEALKSYLESIEIDNSRPGRYMSAGQICCKLEDKEKAIEMYKKALELDESNIEYLLTLADFLLDDKRFAQAQFYLEKILKLQPDNDMALEMMKRIEDS